MKVTVPNKTLSPICLLEDLKLLKEYLSSGGDPNVKLHSGNTLLHLTTNPEMARELLQHGYIVDQRNDYGETPLIFATMQSKGVTAAFISELLKYGANVNAISYCGPGTSLSYALICSLDFEVVRELLKYGADVQENFKFITDLPTHYARLLIKFDVIKLCCKKDFKKEIDLFPYKCLSKDLLAYSLACSNEVKIMEKCMVKDNVSLYEIVTKCNTDENAPRNHRLTRLLGSVEKIDYSSLFPVYHDIISDELSHYKKRAHLMEKVSRTNVYACKDEKNLQKVVLNYDCVDKIAEYLCNNDLERLMVAFDSGSAKHDPCTSSSAGNSSAKHVRFCDLVQTRTLRSTHKSTYAKILSCFRKCYSKQKKSKTWIKAL